MSTVFIRQVVLPCALVLAGAFGVSAQRTFTLNGRLKVEGGGVDGSQLVVYKEGEKDRVISSGLNKFSMELEVNTSYVLSFEKDGFVTKKLSFDTHAPAEAAVNGFTPFDFAVSLFKQYDGVNTVVFNQPVGVIRFDQAQDDFDYDTDYTKSIQSALQDALEEVAKKQEEEKKAEEVAAKQKEEDDKAKAKADAEAQKQAAALAKQQAKVKPEPVAKKPDPPKPVAEVKKPAPKPQPVVAKPPPPPVAKVEKAPKPKPAPRVAHSNPLLSKPMDGSDKRRTAEPLAMTEPSRVQPAKLNKASEARPKFEETPVQVARHEELIVEPNQVVTVVRVETGEQQSEYRKVVRKYSGTFYFKNGESCTKLIYESEALAEVK